MSSGIRIVEVRIRNFRSLRTVDVPLESQTLLVGENNAGKSGFLDALHAAIGAGQRSIGPEDIHLMPGENKPPRDREVLIDILVRPVDAKDHVIDTFPEGSPWLELWGNGVSQDASTNDFVGIRAQLGWSSVRGEYQMDRHFLVEWGPSEDLSRSKLKRDPVRAVHLEPIGLHYLPAARDIQGDMAGRASLWSRLVAEPELPRETVEEIERQLDGINQTLMNNSPVLSHVQDHLRGLDTTVGCNAASVRITPLSRHLTDMKRGMDVVVAANEGPPFPISRQGMGTRSVSTILTLRAFMTWKLRKAADEPLHPLVAVEEPETHLQPQAQGSIMRHIAQIPGQRIITTHSPKIAAQAPITQFRHFRKEGNETRVRSFECTDLSEEDLRKINRQVLHTRGELLFARGVVLFEGETEEQAIPTFAEAFWGRRIEDSGLTFLGVGGSGGYLPFLRLALRFGIPWYIVGDSEPDAINKLNQALAAEKLLLCGANPQVFLLPNSQDFESYIAAPPYHQLLVEMFIDSAAETPEHRIALQKEWANKPDLGQAIAAKLRTQKTRFGALASAAIVASPDPQLRVPGTLSSLFSTIASDLALLRGEGTTS